MFQPRPKLPTSARRNLMRFELIIRRLIGDWLSAKCSYLPYRGIQAEPPSKPPCLSLLNNVCVFVGSAKLPVPLDRGDF